MGSFLIHHWHWILALVGGVSGVIGVVLSGVKPAVHWIIQKALNDPKYHDIILKYRSQIEAFFDSVDAQVKEDLDNAK